MLAVRSHKLYEIKSHFWLVINFEENQETNITVHQNKITVRHCHVLIMSCLRPTFQYIMNIDIFRISTKIIPNIELTIIGYQ